MKGGRIFSDREEAGRVLGKRLTPAYCGKGALVFGIPRGGVPVAAAVAKAIRGELGVLITKKLPHPLQEELAIGACAEDGSVFLTSYSNDIDRDALKRIVQEQLNEIRSRVSRFRQGKRLPEIKGRTVIIVDDGIATGSTLVPAIKLCQSQKAARIVVASPVSGKRYVSEIDALADEVVIAVQPSDFHSVGQVFEDFHPLCDEEVVAILRQHERGYHHTMARKFI
ncbi:MAG TPA: phosphoribosyltransferase family protein [Cyclobacteriaceae bacterium]|jgi:putative phosphoribosyl transferase|nr:phosphoribosyltransferase family protein [Cyclobacteriaceae bacterium]